MPYTPPKVSANVSAGIGQIEDVRRIRKMFVPVSGSRHVPGLAIDSVRGGVVIDVWGQAPEGFFGAGKGARHLAVNSGLPAAEALLTSSEFSNMV